MSLNLDQKSAVEKLSKLKAGALFMKMGTGKTKVACDLIKEKLDYIDLVIWLAPAALLHNSGYLKEIMKRGKKFFDKIVFFTIESISQSDVKYFEMRTLAEKNRNFCVVDESLFIKNCNAIRTQRILKDYFLFDFRIILNGTPITRSLLDLYSQISFLSPNILNMTERQFADNFLIYFFDGIDPFPWRRWSKPANVEALVEIIRPYIFDSDFHTQCSLKIYNKEFRLSSMERKKYEAFKSNYLKDKLYVTFFSVAQTFQRAYSVSCKAKYCETINLVNKILKRGEKVVIFVKYVAEAVLLKSTFDALLYMGTYKDDLSKFESEKDILICTYGVGSLGLNLQCANNLIYYSQTFDYKEKEQAKFRIYRTGQTKTVNIYNMWVDTRLEDVIRYSLSRKRDLLKNVESVISTKKALEL